MVRPSDLNLAYIDYKFGQAIASKEANEITSLLSDQFMLKGDKVIRRRLFVLGLLYCKGKFE